MKSWKIENDIHIQIFVSEIALKKSDPKDYGIGL